MKKQKIIGNLPIKKTSTIKDNKSVTFNGNLVFFNGNRVTYNPPVGD